MRRVLNCVLILGIAGVAAGCGKNDGMLRTRFQVVKDGENFVTPEGQHLQAEFVPIPENGKPPKMFYWAEVNQETGVIRPDGPQKKGMPPGKYRVALALMDEEKKDVFGGKFNAEKSPFVFEVDEDTDELVIDLDDPPAQTHAVASGSPGGPAGPAPARTAGDD